MTPNRIDLAIGSQIRRQRHVHQMSIYDFSDIIGVSEFEAAQFEKGTKRVTAPTLIRICRLFGVSVRYFFDAFDLDAAKEAGVDTKY